MAETTSQTQGAGTSAATCANAAGAHIDQWADGGSRATRDETMAATSRRNIRGGRGRETVWGGDRDDPRLFYFRALLASGRFFGGVTRA
jgi:hypothetical protein